MSQSKEPIAVRLVDFQWKNRCILIFSPQLTNEAAQSQLRLLEQDAEGLTDRDLVLLHLGKNEGIWGKKTISPASVAAIRKQLQIGEQESTLVLIGKDGGVKLRQAFPVPRAQLYGLIDAMPMRRQEMKEPK